MSNVKNVIAVDVTAVKLAQDLQKKREAWKARLEAVPGAGRVEMKEFPYASLQDAHADGYAQFFGGEAEAYRLLVKGWKTRAWRKGAEKNRKVRDGVAEALIKAKEAEAKAKAEAKKKAAVPEGE